MAQDVDWRGYKSKVGHLCPASRSATLPLTRYIATKYSANGVDDLVLVNCLLKGVGIHQRLPRVLFAKTIGEAFAFVAS